MLLKNDKPSQSANLRSPLVYFLIKGLSFFMIWDLIVYPYLIWDVLHNWIIYGLLDSSVFILKWFYPHSSATNTECFVNGIHCIHVGIPCDGIGIMGIFSCIVLAYRAKWYHKFWLLIVSYLLIFTLNSLRIAALAILVINQHKKAVDISHKYIFNVLLYIVLLILFWKWTMKFGIKSEEQD